MKQEQLALELTHYQRESIKTANLNSLELMQNSIIEIDLHLSYFDDIIQISYKNFQRKLQEFSPSDLLHQSINFSKPKRR